MKLDVIQVYDVRLKIFQYLPQLPTSRAVIENSKRRMEIFQDASRKIQIRLYV